MTAADAVEEARAALREKLRFTREGTGTVFYDDLEPELATLLSAARAAGLREAADDMERVMAFGVMRIPVVGMATTLRDKATAIERGEI